MGLINQPTNLVDRVIDLERAVNEIRKMAGLTSAIMGGGSLTVAAGNIYFGNVANNVTGQRVTINSDGVGIPRIDIYDDTTTDHTTQVMFGGNLLMQRERNSDRGVDGGKILFTNATSLFCHTTDTSDAFIAFGGDEGIQVKGWWVQTAISGKSAVVIGFDDGIGTGPISVAYSYGATMVNRMNPIGTVQGSDANRRWAITASSATGFTLGIDAGTSNKFHWWAYRSNN